MNIVPFNIDGLFLLSPGRFGEDRGYFAESRSRQVLLQNGIDIEVVHDCRTLLRQAGTVRGLHFQRPPHVQAKLVGCGLGRLFCVAVDLRRGSPTYSRWTGVELSEDDGLQFFIPSGFAHGFVTREPDTEIVYRCSGNSAPDGDGVIFWNDPAIGIDWGISDPTALSAKDAAAPLLVGFDSPFLWEGAR
ncbi:dTDP-4-dehydrorhamnose 3,5-epimerase [Gemmobacter sp.]|uniref:dTDP-4-dehydrorhamnose 3,5-epimerase n=1 Tax=Gemmobacter sp. TaxID=1898957 RepID=UPI002AFEF118|nr:dTDP-4-dehydrorhamnose 3,5-epimerase [Gemmobacter sp.]